MIKDNQKLLNRLHVAGICKSVDYNCAGISGLILWIPVIYTKTCAGTQTGSMAYHSGECNWSDGIYFTVICVETA